MNKKVTIVAVIFMFFLATCGAFAQGLATAKVNDNLIAQRHHRSHHRQHYNPETHKRVCPPHCKCIRDGFCRPDKCSPKCMCHNCKVVPKHRHNHRPHKRHHHHNGY